MSPESHSSYSEGGFTEGESMQLFMEKQAEVLGQVFGKDETRWMEWLNQEETHGEHLRELLTKCYKKDQCSFGVGCVSEVVETLRHELEVEDQVLH